MHKSSNRRTQGWSPIPPAAAAARSQNAQTTQSCPLPHACLKAAARISNSSTSRSQTTNVPAPPTTTPVFPQDSLICAAPTANLSSSFWSSAPTMFSPESSHLNNCISISSRNSTESYYGVPRSTKFKSQCPALAQRTPAPSPPTDLAKDARAAECDLHQLLPSLFMDRSLKSTLDGLFLQ